MKINILSLFLISLVWAPLVWGAGSTAKLEQDVEELKRVQESHGRVLAEATQNLASIQQQIQELKGSMEELRHFLQEGSAKNEKMLREFDYRLTGIEERTSLYGAQIQEFLGKPASVPGGKKKAQKEDDAEGALYRRALAEINLQNFKSASSLFDQFLQKFPKSTLADNAQYWKAEALYATKDYPNAVLEFQKVIKKFPKSEKVPGAILKQAYCFYEAKEYTDAKAFLQKLITAYPASEEAALAKERIHKIDAPATLPAATLPTRN